jgi:hypothetical protein
MAKCSRRSVLASALASALSLVAGRANPQTQTSDDPKRTFVRRANEEWKLEFELAAEEAARRGVSRKLEPPQELVPFKDRDYYFTKGRAAVWTPNPGQKYKSVTVPVGFVTDLASVPQWAWSFGIRPEGSYAYAAIVHDYLYWMQDRSRDEADSIFLVAMEDSKVENGWRYLLYAAVRLAGQSPWDCNTELKSQGERRLLREFPTDFTISWNEWKRRPGVFRD